MRPTWTSSEQYRQGCAHGAGGGRRATCDCDQASIVFDYVQRKPLRRTSVVMFQFLSFIFSTGVATHSAAEGEYLFFAVD